MHVLVDATPKKVPDKMSNKRKLIIIVSIIGFLVCLGVGIYLLLAPTNTNESIQPEVQLGYNISILYSLGVNPAAYNQHIVKIEHNGGNYVEDMNATMWITIYPPDDTPYLRRSPVKYDTKYLSFEQGDSLYLYMGLDQLFHVSRSIPEYSSYIDFPSGKWSVHIDDARYQSPMSKYDFEIFESKTHLINKNSKNSLTEIISSAQPYDTIFVEGNNIYHEQIVMSEESIRLYGMNNPVIDAGGYNSVISIFNCTLVDIRGFEIVNSGTKNEYEAGVLLKNSKYITIMNNTIHSNQNGIFLSYSDTNDIRYNFINTNDVSGIALTAGSKFNTVKDNDIQLNTIGIYVKDASDSNYIVKNTGHGNTRYGMLIDNKLKNIYEYNNFSYDIMSYDRIVEESLTTYSEDKSNPEDWLTTCGSHESEYSPACAGIKQG